MLILTFGFKVASDFFLLNVHRYLIMMCIQNYAKSNEQNSLKYEMDFVKYLFILLKIYRRINIIQKGIEK